MNEHEKAIEVLNKLIRGSVATLHSRSGIEALEMAIEALEREIPKKPVSEDRCPLCGGIVSYYYSPFNIGAVTETKDNFCATCGQAIDWGKSNDERNGD